MSSREGRPHGTIFCGGKRLVAELFDVDPDYLESLSWSLGDRVTAAPDAARLCSPDEYGSNRSVTVFEATDHTCLIRLRTPTGREKYYGAAIDDVLDPAPAEWTRTE